MKNKKYLILYFLVIICLLINVFFINQLKFSITINEANNNKIMLKTSLLQTNTISGEGTMENPYQISTEEQLFWFSEFVNQGNTNIYAILTNDITINNNVLNSNGELNDGSFKQWIPIGNEDNRFQGIFDGNNYTISGLYVKDENNCYIGLFGRINKGYIINVNVKDSYFYGKQSVGGIVGDNTGVVKDCSSNCYISGSLEAIGGISGGNFGTIENCYSEGKICGSSFVSTEMNSSGKYYDVTVYCQAIGGITGGNYGVIENCYNIGDISGSSNIGGITGWNNGTIVDCYNKGNINCNTVSTHAYAGGIAGYGSILASITNCYNTGDVTSNKHDVGGIIGYVESSSKNGITKCYNTGNISGYTYVGGIVGYNQVAIKYCYNQGNITGNRYVGGIVGFNKASKKTYGSLLACYTIGEVIGQVVGNSAQPMDLGVVTGNKNQGNISNCYYLESIGNSLSDDTLSISKTLEQFTNGEVTYLLNSSLDIEIYKQTLEVDTYPNYTGKNVYYNDEENTYQNHIHKWEYVIENNEIVVRCNNSECSNNYGGSIKIIEPSSLLYTGNAIQPEVSITSKLNDEVIITLLEINNSKLIDGKSINVGEYQINVTVKDETISLKYSIIPLDLSEFDINIETLTFNGSYQNPNVVIKNENQNLVENTDYIIENDSKFDASSYTLQIKGIGNYTGEVSKQWKIKPLDITNAIVTLENDLTYNGKNQTQEIKSVKINDLDVTYEVFNDTNLNASSYTLQIKGIGNYTGEVSKQWKISPLDITNAIVTLGNDLTYNGKKQTQEIKSVKINDLDVTYEVFNNTNLDASSYTLQIKGTGNYTGEISKQWKINPLDITNAIVTLGNDLTYNGKNQTQEIKSVKINDLDVTYEVFNNTNLDASSYTLQIKGTGNYTGEISKQWKILKKDITILAISQNILYGKNIKYDAYTENGLLEGHNLNLSLIPNTNNITSSGKISIVINDITYDLVSVLNNYNITTIPGDLTIEPDLTNINNLSIENVKSSDYEKINQVIQMMNTAERENALEEDIQRWDTIINTCNSLINKIEEILQEINNLTILVNNYDASKINSNDINDFNNLSNQIDSLIASNNTTNQEVEQLNNLKKQLNVLQNNIDNVIKENERLKTEVLKYKDKALTTDKEELSNLLEAIEKQLTLTNLTDEEIINLNNNKLIIEAEIQKINLLIETVSEKVNIVLNYNESIVNANDKETLINLINDIKTLTTNTSLSYLEINELNRAKIKANNLVTTINNITNKIYIIDSQITEELVINIDNYELIINCLNNIDNILSSSNLTNEEKTHLNELQEKAKKYVLTINNAQKALQSENIKNVISINEQNVKLDNKDDLLKAQSEINLLWTNYVNNYTTSEKELIKNYLQNISNSLVIIENAENVVDDIAKISIKTFTKEINKVKEKYGNLSDYEKTLVDNATNNKLDSIIKTKTIIFVVVTVLLGITLIVFFVKWINKKQKRHN